MTDLEMLLALEAMAETQQHIITALATRLAEIGDVETGQQELTQADAIFRKLIGNNEKEVNPL